MWRDVVTRPASTVSSRAASLRETTFVLIARGVEVEDCSLDLVDLAPSTICVEWDDRRQVSYLTTGQFLDMWWGERTESVPASFALLSPAPLRDDGVLLTLSSPRIVGSGLRWTVTAATGWLPHTSGACVLVLNPPDAATKDRQPGR